MKELLLKFKNALCEVKDMENQLILLGRLHRVIEDDPMIIEIRGNDGASLRLATFGIPVKISLRQGRNEILILRGDIFGADARACRINNIIAIQASERRRFFRVPINVVGKIELLTPEDVDNIEVFDVQLIDISLSGLKFSSEAMFNLHDEVKLYGICLRADLPEFTFRCTIVDYYVTETGSCMYRCHFLHMDVRSSDALCKTIFSLDSQIVKQQMQRFL